MLNAAAGEDTTDYHSDSDSDLKAELTKALLKSSKAKLSTNDFEAAEHLFCNCLFRMSETAWWKYMAAHCNGLGC